MITQPKLQVVHPRHANMNASIVEAIRSANSAITPPLEAPSGEAIGYFSQTSVEQIVRSVLRQLVVSGETFPQLAPQTQSTVSIPKNTSRVLPADLGLTDRQTEVLRIVAQGKSNKEIGRALNIAQGTVKIHIRAICEKLNVTRRTEAIVVVNQMGLML